MTGHHTAYRATNAAREALGMAKSPPVSTDADEDEQEPGCPIRGAIYAKQAREAKAIVAAWPA